MHHIWPIYINHSPQCNDCSKYFSKYFFTKYINKSQWIYPFLTSINLNIFFLNETMNCRNWKYNSFIASIASTVINLKMFRSFSNILLKRFSFIHHFNNYNSNRPSTSFIGSIFVKSPKYLVKMTTIHNAHSFTSYNLCIRKFLPQNDKKRSRLKQMLSVIETSLQARPKGWQLQKDSDQIHTQTNNC